MDADSEPLSRFGFCTYDRHPWRVLTAEVRQHTHTHFRMLCRENFALLYKYIPLFKGQAKHMLMIIVFLATLAPHRLRPRSTTQRLDSARSATQVTSKCSLSPLIRAFVEVVWVLAPLFTAWLSLASCRACRRTSGRARPRHRGSPPPRRPTARS